MARNQNGFAHLPSLLLVVLVLVSAVFVGYRVVNDKSASSIAYEGTLVKTNCSATRCISYQLKAGKKVYDLVLKSTPQIASGSQVKVEGSQSTSASSGNSIDVSSIAPANLSPSLPATTKGGSTNAGQVMITNANNGQTINLTAGQQLVVTLIATKWLDPPATGKIESNQSAWSLSSSNQSVLGATSINHSTTSGSLVGEEIETTTGYFSAESVGSTKVSGTSSNSPDCGPKTMCPQYIALLHYSVTVNVSAS